MTTSSSCCCWPTGSATGRRFRRALTEVTSILRADPNNTRAKTLKQQIESTILLRAEAMQRQEEAGPEDRGDRLPSKPPRRPEFPTLTPDQINLIKVYEVSLSDPPRLSVDRETIRRLVEAYSDHDLIPKSREGRARSNDARRSTSSS